MTSEIAKNRNSVPRRQWDKWDNLSRHVFNKTYEYGKRNAEILCPPGMGTSDEQMEVIAWNMAWIAADVCRRGQ